MSLHQSKRRSVSKKAVANEDQRGKKETTVAAFYRGQNTNDDADHFLLWAEAVRLSHAGLGRFVNRGRGFLRYDTSVSRDAGKPDLNFHGGNASRSIDEATMNAFVAEQRYAVAAVESWASKSRLDA